VRRHRAFTLTELLIVVALIAVLAGAVEIESTKAVAWSHDKAAISQADGLAENFEHYAALNAVGAPDCGNAYWASSIACLGTLAEFSETPPTIFQASSSDSSGTYLRSYSDGTTFQIKFRAAGGTGTGYCRDANGLATLGPWSDTAGPWSGCP